MLGRKKSVKCNRAHIHDFNHVSFEVKLNGITELIQQYLFSILLTSYYHSVAPYFTVYIVISHFIYFLFG